MLFMVVERFKNRDAVSIYRRAREQGRMMPEGLRYVGSCSWGRSREVGAPEGLRGPRRSVSPTRVDAAARAPGRASRLRRESLRGTDLRLGKPW
jgi:hypothetical protein